MKSKKSSRYFLAICKDRLDDPDGFYYTVYFINHSASEVESLFYETMAFATIDDEFVQTNTHKAELGKMMSNSAVEIEQDDDESFEFVINFKFTIKSGNRSEAVTFSIPKYLRGLDETTMIPILNKPGWIIYD